MTSSEPPPLELPPGASALLRDRAVAPLLAAELLMSAAGAAVITTLGWQGYARSGDALVLGLLGLAEFVPAAVLALPAGQLADRHDRRRLTMAALVGIAAVSCALAADAAAGDRRIWPLYLLAFLFGVAQAFLGPAFTPLLAGAVPAASLSRAIALSSIAWQSATIAGPAVAGLLNRISDPAPYVAAALMAAASALVVAVVPRGLGLAHVEGERQPPSLREALAGVRLILATPALLGAISLDLMAVLLGGATALLPIFSSDILHVGPAGNGLLRAAPGIGAVLVGATLAGRPLSRRVGPVLFCSVAAYGAFTIVFGLSRSFVLSLLALAALAGADMVSVLIRSTLGPLLTPPELRGRVGAVERVFIGASNELGAFESGVLAALIGAVPAVVLGGAASILIACLWAWRFPQLRRVDRFEQIEPAVLDRP